MEYVLIAIMILGFIGSIYNSREEKEKLRKKELDILDLGKELFSPEDSIEEQLETLESVFNDKFFRHRLSLTKTKKEAKFTYKKLKEFIKKGYYSKI